MNFCLNTRFSCTIIDSSLLQQKTILNQKVCRSDIICRKEVSEEPAVCLSAARSTDVEPLSLTSGETCYGVV